MGKIVSKATAYQIRDIATGGWFTSQHTVPGYHRPSSETQFDSLGGGW